MNTISVLNMSINPFIATVVALSAGFSGSIITRFVMRMQVCEHCGKLSQRELDSMLSEFTIITIIIFLAIPGSGNAMYLLGYVLVSFFFTPHSLLISEAYPLHGTRCKAMGMYKMINFVYGIGYSLIVAGITLGWAYGTAPYALTIISLIYLGFFVFAGDSLVAWTLIRRLFVY